MTASGQNPGRLPESAIAVQIDTALYRAETFVSHGVQRFGPSFNRTALEADSNKHPDELAFYGLIDMSSINPIGDHEGRFIVFDAFLSSAIEKIT